MSWIHNAYQNAYFNASLESQFAAKTYAKYLCSIIDSLPGLEGALDIGAGNGAFLEQLIKIGFTKIEGVEPSHAPLMDSKPQVAPLIRQGIFDPAIYTKNSMSLISCLQTIEHVDNPLHLFESTYDLLKPGGCLFIVAHNHLSLSTRLMGTRSPIFDLEHLQLLSQKTMRKFYERVGFQRVRFTPVRNSYPLSYWLKLMPFGIDIKNKIIAFVGSLGMAKINLSVYAGNLAAAGFKPLSKSIR